MEFGRPKLESGRTKTVSCPSFSYMELIKNKQVMETPGRMPGTRPGKHETVSTKTVPYPGKKPRPHRLHRPASGQHHYVKTSIPYFMAFKYI
jgi:hypothetical protein